MKIPNNVDRLALFLEIAQFIIEETKYPNLHRLLKFLISEKK